MEPLITTKLCAPRLRRDLVLRPQLAARVGAGLQGPLTLIVGPAGFGKTTLAASALAGVEGGAAWLTLDDNDNEAGRFLAYLLAAVQAAAPGVGDAASDWLRGPQLVDPTAVLGGLLNDLAQRERETGRFLVVVLDDYHVIHDRGVHAAVSFLLDHAGAGLRVVLATRSDPPLPLARLRARGQLVEVRAAELRFSVREAAFLLNEVAGLKLADELVALLAERTEGWVAGLQLAALRLQAEVGGEARDKNGDRDDGWRAAFIQRFSGTQRYILDYLVEEVLERQPQPLQRFLLLTSPLPRLCPSLCDVVLQAADEGVRGGDEDTSSSATLLATLEQTNVFLTPLDEDGHWYRYHHLFADLLRARLREQDAQIEARLHAAAAGWFEAQGLIAEAVREALAAGDGEWAARLVEVHTAQLLARGELALLVGSIADLPLAVRRRRPGLCIEQAYALAFAGHLRAAAAALDLAEEALATDGQTDGRLSGAALAVRSMLAVMGGDEEQAARVAGHALGQLPPTAHWDRAAAYWALGYARRTLGDLDGAGECFAEQIRLARLLGNVWTLVTGLTDLALVLRAQGELGQAEALLEEALQAAKMEGARSAGYIARMETGLAAILYERNETRAAQQMLGDAITHVEQWPNPNHIVYANLMLARLEQARGEVAAACAAMQTAHQVYQQGMVTRVLRHGVETGLVRLWLAQGAQESTSWDSASAAEAQRLAALWRDELTRVRGEDRTHSEWDEAAEMRVLALVGAGLSEGIDHRFLSMLEQVAASAGHAGRIGVQIEALVSLAGLLVESRQREAKGRGNAKAWNETLEEALRLAGPRGYVRVFLDGGASVHEALARWVAAVGEHPWRSYALRLLAAFEAERAGNGPALSTATKVTERAPIAPYPAVADKLIEPLSEREREVLALLAQGLSNQQIAAQLIVAPGTVKAHTAAIYRKLDVANRTEAAARARRLGLL